jgi:serine/threonine kinase 32
MPCLHAISSLLEKDRSKRIGAISFESFTDNPFFRAIDFEALEKKQVPPIFIPSSEKTNFDATYDLEELLLEEAPLEARARRQKPRAQLKEDATDKEIRDDELHRMIEQLFEPFDYTHAPFDPCVLHLSLQRTLADKLCSATLAATEVPQSTTQSESGLPEKNSRPSADELTNTNTNTNTNTDSRAPSPRGSPPLAPSSPPMPRSDQPPPQHNMDDYFPPGSQNKLSKVPTAGQSTNHRARAGTRSASKGGGMQVVLGETGSWSELADKSSTLPAEGKPGSVKGGKPSGLLGFMNRKGGRARSPKPREAGVLGKEGARVVVGGR